MSMLNQDDARYEVLKGEWMLIAPNGRKWTAESPLHCVRAELNDRVPATVQLQRIMKACKESDFAERHLQLAKFYYAENVDDLVDKMQEHIERMQTRLAGHYNDVVASQPVRIG